MTHLQQWIGLSARSNWLTSAAIQAATASPAPTSQKDDTLTTMRMACPGTPPCDLCSLPVDIGVRHMARKYSKSASKDVERAMHKKKRGTLKSGRIGKTVKSRKQAIAIGLSEAREKGKKVPKKKASSS